MNEDYEAGKALVTANILNMQNQQLAESRRRDGLQMAMILVQQASGNQDLWDKMDSKGILDLALDVIEESLKGAKNGAVQTA